MTKGIKKIVLAYSGGLDTSIIIPWLKENYDNPEIIAVSGDVGQNDELEGLEEKAIKTGASKCIVMDLKEEFVQNYIYPTLKFHIFFLKYAKIRSINKKSKRLNRTFNLLLILF